MTRYFIDSALGKIRAIAASEEWRPAPGYEGRYEVSSLGRVRSLPRTEVSAKGRRVVRGCVLKPGKNADGYLHVSMRTKGRLRMERIHRLVALAFHGPGNALHREVAHLDGNPANARADNLKWVSKVENARHKRAHGTHSAGERNGFAKLTEEQVRTIRKQANEGRKQAAIAFAFGISRHTVSDIARHRRWSHVA